MQAIHLQDHWRTLLSVDETLYFEPTVDDSTWQPLPAMPPSRQTDARLWLRHWFTMPPNEECSTWWLELPDALPNGTQIWVNYEAIDLSRPRDITYAIFMGENVVTLWLPRPAQGEQWQKIAKIALIPRPCLL